MRSAVCTAVKAQIISVVEAVMMLPFLRLPVGDELALCSCDCVLEQSLLFFLAARQSIEAEEGRGERGVPTWEATRRPHPVQRRAGNRSSKRIH